MNKFILLTLCIFCIAALTGCESDNDDRTKMFSEMENQQIILKGYNKFDMVSICHLEVEICKCDNYYIYKDNNSNMIAINYEKNISKYGNHDYVVTLYNNVFETNDFNNISKDEANCFEHTYYKYENGNLTNNNKYIFSDTSKKTYYVEMKKNLFSTRYIFSEN